jgi:hypothetical protein
MMISTNGVYVENESEAEALMIHHLDLAARLFEATHDDRGERARALARLKLDHNYAGPAAIAFIDRLCVAYAELEDEAHGRA